MKPYESMKGSEIVFTSTIGSQGQTAHWITYAGKSWSEPVVCFALDARGRIRTCVRRKTLAVPIESAWGYDVLVGVYDLGQAPTEADLSAALKLNQARGSERVVVREWVEEGDGSDA